MLYRTLIRPAWALATLAAGPPRFRGLEQYVHSTSMQDMAAFIGSELSTSVDWDYLKAVRDNWNGPMVVKGIMTPGDAERCVTHGMDGVWVSNHGARQFDAAPASISVLPDIVASVGNKTKVLFDSGPRTGLDIARAIALGADMVFLGRAFMFGVGALGKAGGEHVYDLLEADLKCNMMQIGCNNLTELPLRLAGRA